MKRSLKSILCGILAIAAAASVFTGCGSKDIKKDTKQSRTKDTTSVTSDVDWNQIYEPREIWLFDLDDEDIFKTGYYGQQVELEYPTDKLIFARYWSDDVEWNSDSGRAVDICLLRLQFCYLRQAGRRKV